MWVLVTGGTGVLGRELVARLRAAGDEVRVLSRRAGDQPGLVRGDLETGEGVAAAVRGVDAIAHCASSADYRRPQRDIAQTRRLLEAATQAGRPHIVYISIVGVDRIRFGYFRAQLAAERLIETSGLPWTILRTTQFHDLLMEFLTMVTRFPVVLVPRGFPQQSVEVTEVADRMADLVRGEPAGRVPDLGGPRVADTAAMARTYLAATGRRRPVIGVPIPGRVAADFRAGHQLATGGERGERGFEDYLRSRLASRGVPD